MLTIFLPAKADALVFHVSVTLGMENLRAADNATAVAVASALSKAMFTLNACILRFAALPYLAAVGAVAASVEGIVLRVVLLAAGADTGLEGVAFSLADKFAGLARAMALVFS